MKLILQKVLSAEVTVDGIPSGSIKRGYLLYLGVIAGDTSAQAKLLAEKICSLRLYEGEAGKINDRSILDVQGDILVVSQFTLAAKTEKGNRPDYTAAEEPSSAKILYEYFIATLKHLGIPVVEQGEFGAHMKVESINDGPVTLILER